MSETEIVKLGEHYVRETIQDYIDDGIKDWDVVSGKFFSDVYNDDDNISHLVVNVRSSVRNSVKNIFNELLLPPPKQIKWSIQSLPSPPQPKQIKWGIHSLPSPTIKFKFQISDYNEIAQVENETQPGSAKDIKATFFEPYNKTTFKYKANEDHLNTKLLQSVTLNAKATSHTDEKTEQKKHGWCHPVKTSKRYKSKNKRIIKTNCIK
eukprot:54546_1